jgi:hypothetical protein
MEGVTVARNSIQTMMHFNFGVIPATVAIQTTQREEREASSSARLDMIGAAHDAMDSHSNRPPASVRLAKRWHRGDEARLKRHCPATVSASRPARTEETALSAWAV